MRDLADDKAHPRVFRQPWRIRFEGEPGIDQGGLAREWWGLIMQRLFDPNSGLFSYAATDMVTHTINPLSPLVVDNHRASFHFVGRLLGKALLDGQTIDPHLTRY